MEHRGFAIGRERLTVGDAAEVGKPALVVDMEDAGDGFGELLVMGSGRAWIEAGVAAQSGPAAVGCIAVEVV